MLADGWPRAATTSWSRPGPSTCGSRTTSALPPRGRGHVRGAPAGPRGSNVPRRGAPRADRLRATARTTSATSGATSRWLPAGFRGSPWAGSWAPRWSWPNPSGSGSRRRSCSRRAAVTRRQRPRRARDRAGRAARAGPLHLATHALPVSERRRDPAADGAARPARRAVHDPLEPALQRHARRVPARARPARRTAARACSARYEALCALLLDRWPRRCSPRGSRAASRAAMAAARCWPAMGTPYMALMAATGPTPNFLVPLLTAVRAARSPLARDAGRRAAALGAGSSAGSRGLGLCALALPALAGVRWRAPGRRPASDARGRRLRLRRRLLLGASPLAIARAIGAPASSPVTSVRPRWLWIGGTGGPCARGGRACSACRSPLVVDGPRAVATAWHLGIALDRWRIGLVMVPSGVAPRGSVAARSWGCRAGRCFALSRRTGRGRGPLPLRPRAVRCWRSAGCGHRPHRRGLRGGRGGPGAASHRRALARAGQRILRRGAGATPRTPPGVAGAAARAPCWTRCDRAGRAQRVREPCSSPAGSRLESERARCVASQAWNERIPGDPLRFRDEVDLDPQAAWVLSSHLSRGMPRAAAFPRARRAELGGPWTRGRRPGDFVRLPRGSCRRYDEARPVPRAAFAVLALDGTALPAAVARPRPGDGLGPRRSGSRAGSGSSVRPGRRGACRALVAGPWTCARSPLATCLGLRGGRRRGRARAGSATACSG